MNIIAMFVLGLLIGWLAEWALDWYYWRARLSRTAGENAILRQRITALEARKNPIPLSAKKIPIVDADGNDNFQAIKGIGPVFAKRLKEAGVLTFEQLSRMTSKQLEDVLGNLYKRFFSKEEQILAQAKEFARQRAQMS